ncbi:MAG: ATP-dependent zinc metalloprotease FtsH [Caulobacterales bacterium]|nr:ATP-dependent zinc metalloprotease FtsH [Caulobacterales bacterium]MCA0373761.1 ATP-dependent zinc metalloprotease FtsH [Pseudomonadota bacterium]
MKLRDLMIWGFLALSLIVVFTMSKRPAPSPVPTALAYSSLVAEAKAGNIKNATLVDDMVRGEKKDGSPYTSVIPSKENVTEVLLNSGVQFSVEKGAGRPSILMQIISSVLPFLLFLGVWFLLMRQMSGGKGGGAMGFGKSKAKLLSESKGRVTFEDVAGIDEAREELQEIVDFLKDPQKFQRLGGKIPKGALLVGPPGTGKTLTARAVAGEANVPFFTISGSDFVEMFVGVGASRVRDMFEQAKKNAPCIIFIDEIDAVGRHRGAGLGGGNDEREQTLNQLLVEMDGFEANEGIIIIAATNRPDVLDPALLRPGRFDRQVVVGLPDINGREKILLVHMKKTPLASDVDAKTIARGTPGFSGADLMNLVNEAALLAARRGMRLVTMKEFEDAKDKVMMGVERKTMAMSAEEKENTAYHEAGHAVVSVSVPGSDPIHKATIVPRGRALGMVMSLPEGDRYSTTREWCISRLAILFGGREAELLHSGPEKVTNGATGDIQMATRLARSMVMEWGMSEKLGRVRYQSNEQEVFLGHSVAQSVNISPETAQLIDEEVRKLIEDGEATARRILSENKTEWENVAKALLEFETLTGDEILGIMRGEKVIREETKDDNTPTPSIPTISKNGPMPDPMPA